MAAKRKTKAAAKKSKTAAKTTALVAVKKTLKKPAKKTARAAKKKTPARKQAASTPAKAKNARAGAAKNKSRKAPAKTPVKAKKAPVRKKQTVGEGDYEASRAFLKDQAGFVRKNKAKIPAMGHQAEAALDGPEGDALREAEAAGLARSRDTF